tara:strand:+ start:238 stop:570 length:333 start_codon:yes stop_codon:yes gene_type:complete
MSVNQIILKPYLLIDKEHNYLMDDEGLKDENAFMLLDDNDSDNIKAIAAACRKAKKLLTLGIVKQNGLCALKCWIQEHAQAGINLDTFLSVSLTPVIKRQYAQKFISQSL